MTSGTFGLVPLGRATLASIVCATILAGELHAASPRCPAIEGGNAKLAGLDAEARIAFIRARLRHDAFRARQWGLGFSTGYATIVAGGGTYAAASHDRATKADIYTGAVGAGVGLGLLVFAPLTVIRDHDALEAELSTPRAAADRCRTLALAETMFIRDAKSEAFGRSWFTHTGTALLGIGQLLVLGLGFRRWTTGALTGTVSIAIGELMIFLQPHGLIRDLSAYRRGDLRPPPRRRRRRR